MLHAILNLQNSLMHLLSYLIITLFHVEQKQTNMFLFKHVVGRIFLIQKFHCGRMVRESLSHWKNSRYRNMKEKKLVQLKKQKLKKLCF